MLRLLAALIAVLALAPAASQAAELTLDASHTIHYTAGDGEENRLSMGVLDVGFGIVKDDGVANLTGCSGELVAAGWRHCVNGRRPQVQLGDGDDTAGIADGGSEEMLWIGSAHVDAGSGNDNVRTGGAADVLIGGEGNDTLIPEFGANRVEGGPGDDRLESFFGDDHKIGGPGADTFVGSDGNETIDAADGAGTDTITCGGGVDSVLADAGDTVGEGCETVNRVGPQPKPGDEDDQQPGGGQKPAPGDDPTPPGPPAPPVEPAGPSGPALPAADTRAPKLKIKIRRRAGRKVVTVTADEAVTLKGAGRLRRLRAGRPARITVGSRKRLRLVARDAAGNVTVRRVR